MVYTGGACMLQLQAPKNTRFACYYSLSSDELSEYTQSVCKGESLLVVMATDSPVVKATLSLSSWFSVQNNNTDYLVASCSYSYIASYLVSAVSYWQ